MKYQALAACAVLLAGCSASNDPKVVEIPSAASTDTTETSGTEPMAQDAEQVQVTSALAAGTARVVIYRPRGYEGLIAPSIKPDVFLDGKVVGQCIKATKIVLDVTPGQHEVWAKKTEFANNKTFTIEEGQTAYFRCGIAPGILVPNRTMVVVEPVEGEKKSKDLPVQ